MKQLKFLLPAGVSTLLMLLAFLSAGLAEKPSVPVSDEDRQQVLSATSDLTTLEQNLLNFQLNAADSTLAQQHYASLLLPKAHLHSHILQLFYKGGEGWTRIAPVNSNNSVAWNAAGLWERNSYMGTIPGSGDIQAHVLVLWGNNQYYQAIHRNNYGYHRYIPRTTNGSPNWGAATAWEGPFSIGSLPGSGNLQSHNFVRYPNGTYYQEFHRNNQGYTRTMPSNGDGTPNWNAATGWLGPYAISGLPGTGDLQNMVIARMPDGSYYQGYFRSNQGYQRTVPPGGDGVPNWGAATSWQGPFVTTNVPGPDGGLIQTSSMTHVTNLQGGVFNSTTVGKWADIDYSKPVTNPDSATGLNEHLTRTWWMALQARKANDFNLLQAAEKALTAIYPHIYATEQTMWDQTHSSSGFWEISLPAYLLGPSLVYMKPHMLRYNPSSYGNLISQLLFNTNHFSRAGSSGVNNLFWGRGKVMYALAANNTTVLNEAKNIYNGVLKIASGIGGMGTGVRSDFTYLDHINALYLDRYGSQYANELGLYLIWAKNTGYYLDLTKLNQVAYPLAGEGLRWSMYKSHQDIGARGRLEEPYPQHVNFGFYSLLLFSQLDSSYKNAYIASAKLYATGLPAVYNKEYQPLISSILNSSVTAAGPVGLRHFPESDYTVRRTASYLISIRNQSTRTQMTEDYAGYYRTDGATFIGLNNEYSEYHTAHIWPTFNWYRVPGTTVQLQNPALKAQPKGGSYITNPEFIPYGKTAFVGSAYTNNYGSVALDAKPNYASLTYKRSWHFFDQEMVVINSNMVSGNSLQVVTTINQRPIVANPAVPLVINGSSMPTSLGSSQTISNAQWAFSEAIGYYFPDKPSLYYSRINQSGSWNDIGWGGNTTVRTSPFLTLSLNHGANLSGQNMAYVVIPRTTQTATQTYATSPPITIVKRDAQAHAVEKVSQGMLGLVFWQAGIAVRGISVDTPAVVATKRTGNSVEIALSEPSHLTKAVKLTYPAYLVPTSPTNTPYVHNTNGTTTVTFNVTQGKNYVAGFNVVTPTPTPTATPTSVPTPLPVVIGDMDGDRDIDMADLLRFLPYYGATSTGPADFNMDSKVDLFDVNILWKGFGK